MFDLHFGDSAFGVGTLGSSDVSFIQGFGVWGLGLEDWGLVMQPQRFRFWVQGFELRGERRGAVSRSPPCSICVSNFRCLRFGDWGWKIGVW